MNELLTMLDSKYKRLEYIQSSGTQWIDTGIKPTNNIKIKAKVMPTEQDKFVYGSRTSSTSNDLHCWVFATSFNNIWEYPQFGSNAGGGYTKYNLNEVYTIENGQNGAYLNGIKIKTYDTYTFNSNLNMYLFGLNQNNSLESRTFVGRIYYFQIFDNDTLIRNYIPVLRKSDNEIGMLDLVEGKFYPNAGTGKFTANLDTMYALIQGTPTVQDGRVSGFSGNDYIHTTSVFDTAQNFEIVVKINTGTLITSQLNLICRNAYGNTPGNSGLLFGIGNNKKITTYLDDTEGTRFVNGTTGSTIFQDNTTYLIRFNQTGNTIKLESSSDNGSSWVTENTWTHQYKIRNSGQGLAFGGVGTQTYFPGTLDLNRSYIKIDDTKYKLQAVVGYTKVGNPTIVDGVASGFSANDYITTPVLPSNITNMHLHTEFTISSYLDIQGIFMVNWYPSLEMQYTRFRIYVKNNNGTSSGYTYQGNSVAINTKAIVDFNYQNGISHYVVKQNNITILDVSYNNTVISKSYITFGKDWKPMANGSIDLKETYIKINNKLWFNGLEA